MSGAEAAAGGPPHRLALDVRFRETDAYGVVWHGHYVDWLECARQRYAAAFGFDLAGEFGRGYTAPVVSLALDYRRPARFGERVEVEVRSDPDPRAVFAFRYRINGAGGELLTTGRTVQVLVGPRGLLVAWPERARALRAALAAYEAGLPAW